MDDIIKILTIIKLLIQTTLWGILLGLTIYFLVNNPLPKLIGGLEEQVMKGLLQSGGGR